MNNTPTIEIQNLILKGYRKDYVIKFNPGVNIIYGDHATGKTSILGLIDYMFGAKSFDADTEIQTSVEYTMLEVKLNDTNYVIKRDIFDPNKNIEVYLSEYNEINQHYPKLYTIVKNKVSQAVELYSDFLLTALNMPLVEVKRSPSKQNSEMSRLSFRDIMKYCYAEQDKVGSKHFLDIGNYPVRTKNKETFKYIYSLLDTNITQLQGLVGHHSSLKSNYESQLKSVAEFLRETEFDSSENLNNVLDSLEDEESLLKVQIQDLDEDIKSSSKQSSAYQYVLKHVNYEVDKKEIEIKNTLRNIEQYSKLRNEYENELSKIAAMITSKTLLGDIPEQLANCPICESIIDISSINQEFDVHSDEKLNQEILSIKRRLNLLKKTIFEEKDKLVFLKKELIPFVEEKEKAQAILNDEMETLVAPFLSLRDGLIKELSKLSERKSKYLAFLKIRNKYDGIGKEISKQQNIIDKLNVQLHELQANAPSETESLSRLGATFNNFLKEIGIKNRSKIEISESTYLPVVNNKNYENINSGGDRTIASIGYLFSLFIDGMNKSISLPRFLMIDTVGKYLGKLEYDSSQAQESRSDFAGDSDANIYSNIYNYFIRQSEKCEDLNLTRQIILVDNDVPANIANQYQGFITAHYSRSGISGLQKGLIDDI